MTERDDQDGAAPFGVAGTLGAQMAPQARPAERTGFLDRNAALFITLAAALWAADAYFRPALAKQLSASQIVLVEDLLISVCFIPAVRRVARELWSAPWRTWLALAVIAVGPQAFATVLFTRSISYAYTVPPAQSSGVLSEVYLLYLLQPIFGATMAWIFLRERRQPSFWPLAALALAGTALIVFATNATAPHAQLLAAASVPCGDSAAPISASVNASSRRACGHACGLWSTSPGYTVATASTSARRAASKSSPSRRRAATSRTRRCRRIVSVVIAGSRSSGISSRSTSAKVRSAAMASSSPSPASSEASGWPNFSRPSEKRNSGIGSGASSAAWAINGSAAG